MRAVLAFVFVLAASPVFAQSFTATDPMTVDILRGYDLAGKATLTPDTPGDELVFRNKLWKHVVLIGVAHASKSGPNGQYPTAGLCLEPAQAFDVALVDGALVIADINGDRIDDLVLSAGAKAQALMGVGLSACR
jgi:hypothetical protein